MGLNRYTIVPFLLCARATFVSSLVDQEAQKEDVRLQIDDIGSREAFGAGRFVRDPKPTTYSDIGEEEAREGAGMRIVPMKDFPVSIAIHDRSVDLSISDSLAKFGRWERWSVVMLCERWANSGARGTFLDAGANIGSFSLPLASCLRNHGSNLSLVSVEPFPNNTQRLRAGIKFNHLDNIHLYEYAVGSPAMSDEVFMRPHPTNQGMPRIERYRKGPADPAVRVTTLDSIASREGIAGKVFALKMDIEGSETLAMEGASDLMQGRPCVVFVEASQTSRTGPWGQRSKAQAEFREWLEARGYVYRGKGNHRFFLEDGAEVIDSGGGNDLWMEQPDLGACANRVR